MCPIEYTGEERRLRGEHCCTELVDEIKERKKGMKELSTDHYKLKDKVTRWGGGLVVLVALANTILIPASFLIFFKISKMSENQIIMQKDIKILSDSVDDLGNRTGYVRKH